MLALSLRTAVELFAGGVLASLGAAVAGSIVALFRFIRHQNATLARVEHRQAHVLTWIREAAHHLRIHFPVDDDLSEYDDDDDDRGGPNNV